MVQAVPATFHSSTILPTAESFDVVADAATGAGPAPLEIALRLVRDGGMDLVAEVGQLADLPAALGTQATRTLRQVPTNPVL